jgi:transglutaminase-like putative cysteine protease
MLVDVGCRFTFDLACPTHAVLMVEPHTSEVERVIHGLMAYSTVVEEQTFVDAFDNRARRLSMPAGMIDIEYMASVEVPDEVDPADHGAAQTNPADLPSWALQFMLPSRYCESDLLSTHAWETFGDTEPGWGRVQAVVDYVHDLIEFDYMKSSVDHTAVSVLRDKTGVCRDFTHLGIALCRALNFPARYVGGYLPDIEVPDPGSPMDFCAWMEVLLDGRWYTFDVRNNQRRKGRVVVGRGRDAADVAMLTSFGPAPLVEMTVTAENSPIAAPVHAGVTPR